MPTVSLNTTLLFDVMGRKYSMYQVHIMHIYF